MENIDGGRNEGGSEGELAREEAEDVEGVREVFLWFG